MTYSLNIDQEFALVNGLTLVQVSTLAAFMTLPLWSETAAINGHVWYRFSDDKMSEDFPLLFGVPKRCYKNITELEDMGFVELTKLGRDKYVRFTAKCADWNRGKEQIRTNSPKTDQIKSENGPKNSPKTDSYIKDDYNISNSDISDKDAGGVLFPEPSPLPIVLKKTRGTTEELCLFNNSRYNDFEKFKACFGPDYAEVDIRYYYDAVADWSASKGKKMRDWIATARNFIRGDIEAKKLHKIKSVELPADVAAGLMEDMKFYETVHQFDK